MPDTKVNPRSAADRVFERSRLERPCSGEGYVRPYMGLGNNDVTDPVPNQLPVSPLRVSFDGNEG
jgi:hypothetical protein